MQSRVVGAFTVSLQVQKSIGSGQSSVTINLYAIPDRDFSSSTGIIELYIGSQKKIIPKNKAFYYEKGIQYQIGTYTRNNIVGASVTVKAIGSIDGSSFTLSENVSLQSATTQTPTKATISRCASSYQCDGNTQVKVNISPGKYNNGATYKLNFSCNGYSWNYTVTSNATGNSYTNQPVGIIPAKAMAGTTSNQTCYVTLTTQKSGIGSSNTSTTNFTVLKPTPASLSIPKNSAGKYMWKSGDTFEVGDTIPLQITPGQSKYPVEYEIIYGTGSGSWSEPVTSSANFNAKGTSIKIPQSAINGKSGNTSTEIKIKTINGSATVGTFTMKSKFILKLPNYKPTIVLPVITAETNSSYKLTLKNLNKQYTYKLKRSDSSSVIKTIKNPATNVDYEVSVTFSKEGSYNFILEVYNNTTSYIYKVSSSTIKVNKSESDKEAEKVKLETPSLVRANYTDSYKKYDFYYFDKTELYLKLPYTLGSKAVITHKSCYTSSPGIKIGAGFLKTIEGKTYCLFKITFTQIQTGEVKFYVSLTRNLNSQTGNNIIDSDETKVLTISNWYSNWRQYQKINVYSISASRDNYGKLSFTLKGYYPAEENKDAYISYSVSGLQNKNVASATKTLTKQNEGIILVVIEGTENSPLFDDNKTTIKINAWQACEGTTYYINEEEVQTKPKEYILSAIEKAMNIDFDNKAITIGSTFNGTAVGAWSLYINQIRMGFTDSEVNDLNSWFGS